MLTWLEGCSFDSRFPPGHSPNHICSVTLTTSRHKTANLCIHQLKPMKLMDYVFPFIFLVIIFSLAALFLTGKLKRIPPHKYRFEISKTLPCNLISVQVESRKEIGVYHPSTEYYLKLVTSFDYKGTRQICDWSPYEADGLRKEEIVIRLCNEIKNGATIKVYIEPMDPAIECRPMALVESYYDWQEYIKSIRRD